MDTLNSVDVRVKYLLFPIALDHIQISTLIVNYRLFILIYIVVVKRQEMVSWGRYQQLHALPSVENTLGTSGAQETAISLQFC